MAGYKSLKKGKGRTAGQHSFAQIPRADIPRSAFKRNCGLKTTFDAGDLVPVFWDEILPGDTMNLTATVFSRLSTMIFPIMDNIYLDLFFFAVPNRILWDNWEKFNGAQDDPGDSTSFNIPQVTAHPTLGYEDHSLGDYFGLPVQVPSLSTNALFFRAYIKIWNEWFRSQDLQDSAIEITGDGPNTAGEYGTMTKKRGKRHDYFTSCLPSPQKGVEVSILLGATAPVVGTTAGKLSFDGSGFTNSNLQTLSGQSQAHYADTATGTDDVTWNITGLEADLSAANSSSINQLRESFQIQKLLERDARGGTRYTELIKSHFGVSSDDARLNRSEYLGGGSIPVMITPVANTTSGSGNTQGDLASFGVASKGGIGFRKSFTEHCVLIGLVAARADLHYQAGLERMMRRTTRNDFYWPSFAHLGEQGVRNSEIWADGSGNDDLIFGYQERFAEYRYKPSQVTGLMRSESVGPTLDAWHLAQNFTTLPVLDDAFIQENPPINSRILSVSSEPAFIFDAYFDYTCVRPMPTYSVPGLIDHF